MIGHLSSRATPVSGKHNHMRNQYRSRRDRGLCPRCGIPYQDPDHYHCAPCRERFSVICAARRERRHAAGLCECGLPSDGTHKRCLECREYAVKDSLTRRARNLAAGMCRCGRDRVPGLMRCERCRVAAVAAVARSRARRKAKKRGV